jgi:hypothetical protein
VAIAAQQLYGRGVKLRPGQTIEYVITDADNRVPNDRVRAYALWEGSRGYDRTKYGEMLREAFEVFAKPALHARGYFLSSSAGRSSSRGSLSTDDDAIGLPWH